MRAKQMMLIAEMAEATSIICHLPTRGLRMDFSYSRMKVISAKGVMGYMDLTEYRPAGLKEMEL
jgi:hypothetical protein